MLILLWIPSVVFAVAAIIVLPYAFFKNASNTKFKTEFMRDRSLAQERAGQPARILTKSDIKNLPPSVQRHLQANGAIDGAEDVPLATNIELHTKDVQFFQSRDKKPLDLHYSLFLFAPEVARLVYVKASVGTIPYEGYERLTKDGFSVTGSLKKIIPFFNQEADKTLKNQLVSYLAYSLHLPQSLLSDHISLEQSGENQVKGKIDYGNTSVSGVFTFDDEEGLLSSFRSSDCTYFGFKGDIQQLDWSLHFEDYLVRRSVLFPNSVKAVWHDFDGEDFTYFKAKNFKGSPKTAGGIRPDALSRAQQKINSRPLPWLPWENPPSQK